MHATHEAHVRAALERLKLLGADDRQIAALKQAEQIDPNFTVPAPFAVSCCRAIQTLDWLLVRRRSSLQSPIWRLYG